MRRLICLFLASFLISTPSFAEMEKLALVCENQMCFYWWPKLPIVEGWHHDRENSYTFSANAQAPEGFSFANAETVIYAKAIYKPREPETKSLEMLINNDKNSFLSENPGLVVTEVEALTTADGQMLKSFTFTPKEQGNWERVSYGEEGDFYLIFTISSRSKDGLLKSLEAYKKFINGYKEKP